MFKTKKDVDLHVRSALAKLRSENEKNLRSFTIAKLYFKINEYSTAEQYVSSYLTIKDDNDQAHKLLGQCYQKQKKFEKAIASFQRSLQLNPKQPDLLVEVCQLLVEDKALNTNKAKYWCDLAESEKVQHDAVFSLRLKLMNKDNLATNQVEEIIQKEISSRPQDVNLRIRLVRHFIEQNKILEAYKNTCQLEMVNHNMLAQSAEWYNVVWLVLSKYEQIPNTKKDWQFWCLLITCLEQQVHISFSANVNLPNGGTTETANLLFNFDQYLYKASQIIDTLNQQKELVARFMEHYQGQLCLHAASLIFKRELIQNKNKWKETIKSALPLLLLAYQSERPNTKELWMKHCDEHGKFLIQLWNREGAFRCAQAGRTLASCIEENNENNNELNNILGNASPWTSAEALISQIRQCCSDKNWRRAIFGQLFCNSDQKVKEQTSQLIKCAKLSEPIYELPTYAELEVHEETAQYLNPQSLQHMVYLCLGNDNLAHVRAKFFSGLNFSTQNLSFCGAESLNQLDIETFLYASTLQAKRLLDVERKAYENYHAGTVPKPKVLPFVNIQYKLCSEEQVNWWKAAYQVYKNLAAENLSEIRANLQYGIEAIRGINGPKIDTLIVFELGKIFETRSIDVNKPVEKGMLEARAENLYKYGLNMLKMNNKGILEPYKRYFKYANSNSSSVEREVSSLAENAVSFLAARYFKKSEYEELIDELSGIQLPFATYLQAEAYRKLDEANKTPKKVKRVYLDKASECLNQTLTLLKSYNDPNHPLNSVIPFEMKRLQQTTNKFMSEHTIGNNSSSYEDAETEFGVIESSPLYNGGNNRSRRETSIVSPRTIELENLVKQIANMMTCVKEELVENIKPEVVGLKKEVALLKEKLALIEENMPKKSNAPSRDEDASNVLDDLYIIEDELQNQMYSNQQQHQHQQQMNMYASPYSQQHSMAPRMHTPTAVASSVPPMNPYNNPLYGNYAMNYYAQQLMMPPQQAAANVMGTLPSQLANRNPLGLSYMDSGMNFNIPGFNPSSMMPSATDSRTSNLFGLLTQNTPQQQQQQPLQQQPLVAPIQQQPPPPLSQPTIQGPPLQSITIPPKIQPSNPQVALPSVNVPPPAPITFNKSLNNMPVEKGPPVNVVITSSDPLPTSSAGLQSQPTLSVTIPSHHIKPSLVTANEQINTQPANTSFPMVGPTPSVTSSSASPFTMKYPTPLPTTATSTTTSSPMAFSFKLPPPITNNNLNKTNESNSSDLHKSEPEIEYDPRPDFQPIIPLPDEIEVKTGEENEDVMFSSRSKLFRFADKEWKERGVGDIKILKNKENGSSRILMRRDQTHKICANHRITSELNLTKPKGSDKGFIWAANDFADEELKLEKFLVRFKHAETAEKFEAAFNVARSEAKEALKTTNGNLANKPKSFGFGLPTSFTDNKTSTPTSKVAFNNIPTTVSSTLPKTLFDGLGANKKTEEPKPQTASPFANFSFDKTTSGTTGEPKPFANIFASINNLQNEPSPIGFTSTPPKPAETKTDNQNKSDHEDEYVPTAQFQPVIPLPDLVEVTTGEENELVLFEHRAKLLRFDKSTSEWKERGVGNIKILQDKNDVNKVRLVMRREVIHKLCCNQRLYKDTSFKYMKDSKTALMWAGQDYSENELQVETLVIRFKAADSCKQFLDTITQAQAKMTSAANEENAKNEEPTKAAAPVADKGFGDKFKPKAGSWSCEQCYTSNSADKLYCASCEAPKDDTVPKKDSLESTKPLAKPAFSFGFGALASGAAATKSFGVIESTESAKQNVQKPVAVGFGDKFKPKEGSWTCDQCYTSNTGEKLHCASCEAPKDKTVPKKESSSLPLNGGKSEFKFGFASTPAQPSLPAVSSAQENKPVVAGFGDKFKPKSGSWSCTECYLSNTSDELYCKACDAPKDATVPKKEPVDVLASKTPSQKFTFGFGAVGNAAETAPKTDGSSFSFGKPQQGAKPGGATTTFSFGIPKDSESTNKTTSLFGSSVANADSSKPGEPKAFTFTPAVTAADSTASTTGAISKSTFAFSLPTKTTELNPDKGVVASTYSLDKKDFNFVLKPKSPGKGKSPLKGTNSLGVAGDEDEEEEAADEEENNTYFTPVIPLPDKIEVKTGEEDEDVMFSHRSKLFRFTEGEWKERGLGDVKILRHKQTKKLRVVMRREQVLKICLNHALNEDVIYKNKTDKSWLFIVNDYSEGEMHLDKFCLRFKTKDIADAFMKAVNDCLEGKAEPIQEAAEEKPQAEISSSEKDVKIPLYNKELAEKLMLPYSFYDESSFVSCPGCPGCDPDKFVFPEYPLISTEPDEPLEFDMANVTISNPRSFSLNPSKLLENLTPTQPESNQSTAATGIFSNSNTVANSTTQQSSTSTSTTMTNFSFTQALNSTTKQEEKAVDGGFLFGGGSGTFSFGGAINDKPSFGSKPSIFGGSALFDRAVIQEPKTVASGNGASLFGNNTNISKPSIFGGQQAIVGSVTSSTENSKVIEPADKPNTLFGGTGAPFANAQNPSFGKGSSLFGGQQSAANASAQFIFGEAASVNKLMEKKPTELNAASKENTAPGFLSGSNLFGSSNTPLSFKALSDQTQKTEPIVNPAPAGGFIGLTHTNAFSSFKTTSQTKNDNSNADNSAADDADASDHDPHFEPIIALPDEITVSTGEENEDKLFGARSTLFRYDQALKEWKERGVGELKILKHKTLGTFRLVMRREQIHKLVLNHVVGADFSFNQMANPRCYIWATLNFAEDDKGTLEKLSVRFRSTDDANNFKNTLTKCVEIAKTRAPIETEE